MAEDSGKPSIAHGDVFNVDRIRDLIDLMEERGLCEVDLKQSEQQIRLVRAIAQTTAGLPIAQSPGPAAVAPTASGIDEAHITVVKAPMVGTFYSKANPKADDFVKVGSKVSADTTICIIEAMKVFNEIPAEVSGTIIAVLANDEEPVDYGRPLFKLDTRG